MLQAHFNLLERHQLEHQVQVSIVYQQFDGLQGSILMPSEMLKQEVA
jgi:hypothetical protein